MPDLRPTAGFPNPLMIADAPPPRPWPRSRLLNVWGADPTMREHKGRRARGTVFTLTPDHL